MLVGIRNMKKIMRAMDSGKDKITINCQFKKYPAMIFRDGYVLRSGEKVTEPVVLIHAGTVEMECTRSAIDRKLREYDFRKRGMVKNEEKSN